VNVSLRGVRRVHLARIRYHLYYRATSSAVEVLAFWHARRGTGARILAEPFIIALLRAAADHTDLPEDRPAFSLTLSSARVSRCPARFCSADSRVFVPPRDLENAKSANCVAKCECQTDIASGPFTLVW
jgi:hypothetical protein